MCARATTYLNNKFVGGWEGESRTGSTAGKEARGYAVAKTKAAVAKAKVKAKAKAEPKAKAANKAWQSATSAEKTLTERVPLLHALDFPLRQSICQGMLQGMNKAQRSRRSIRR